MADQKKEDPAKLLWMLGLAMTLPMILISGPLAGYFISYILIHHRGMPSMMTPLLMSLGFIGSAYQTYRLIRKMYRAK